MAMIDSVADHVAEQLNTAVVDFLVIVQTHYADLPEEVFEAVKRLWRARKDYSDLMSMLEAAQFAARDPGEWP